MLDLTKLNNKYELKWFDGQVLTFKLPTQEFLMRIVKIEQIEDLDAQFDELQDALSTMLNSNLEGRKFAKKDLRDISLDVLQAILEDYMTSIQTTLGE